MAKQPITSPQADTQTITKDQWIPFLAEFTRENRGAHGRLEVLGAESDRYAEEDRPFEGISSDIKDGEHRVWITLASTTEAHIAHSIPNVTGILARSSAPLLGPALEIVSKDGTRTLLQLALPEEHALPAAQG